MLCWGRVCEGDDLPSAWRAAGVEGEGGDNRVKVDGWLMVKVRVEDHRGGLWMGVKDEG